MLPEITNSGDPGAAAASSLFAALGDPHRLRLVSRLCGEGPLSITRLTEGTQLTRQAITKHLHVMEVAGLVHGARRGRESVWELDPQRVGQARVYLDQIAKQWDAAIERLRAMVETENGSDDLSC